MSSWLQSIKGGVKSPSSKGSSGRSWARSLLRSSRSTSAVVSANFRDTDSGSEVAKITVNLTASQSPYSVPEFQDMLISVDSTAGAITINLPAIGTVAAGSQVFIKDAVGQSPANAITVVPDSGTIEGLSSVVIDNPFAGLFIYSDGSRWLSN